MSDQELHDQDVDKEVIEKPIGMDGTMTDTPTEGKDALEYYKSIPFNTYEAAEKAFGPVSATFAKNLSEMDFPQFKAGMKSIGFPTLFEDEHRGLRYECFMPYSHKSPRLANAALCMRYPFMLPRSRWTNDVIWYQDMSDAMWDERNLEISDPEQAFMTTELSALPMGWLARFGLEICEDLKTILESTHSADDPMGCYHIDQIKEKFGSLRWYSHGTPNDVYDDEEKLIALYEDISYRTCINCGGLDRIRMTGGYISYRCFECRQQSIDRIPPETICERFNKLLANGKLGQIISMQSQRWKERNNGPAINIDQMTPVESQWQIPYAIRTLIVKDILDDTSRAVGSIESDRILVIRGFKSDSDDWYEEKTDLFEWGDALGLHGVGLARAIDRHRHDYDGDTNLPAKEAHDEEPC